MSKKYWKKVNGEQERPTRSDQGRPIHPEFGEWLEGIFKKPLSRRSFLKWSGLTAAASALSSCWEVPVRKAIPYFVQPEESIPGVATYYATAYFDGEEFASLLVKTREGRPIKIEPHPNAPYNATSARIQGSLFNVYDAYRISKPWKGGQEIDWEKADAEITRIINALKGRGTVRIVTPTVISPATQQVIDQFLAQFADGKHIQYDVVSAAALLDAHQIATGKRVLPNYRIDRAKVVVGVECDFLGGWLSPAEMAKRYGQARKVSKQKPEMLRHIQAEARYSLTGSNADWRIRLDAGTHQAFVEALYDALATKLGVEAPRLNPQVSQAIKEAAAQVADELAAQRGKALVLYGPNDLRGQLVTLAINAMLGAYEAGLADLQDYWRIRQGDDQAFVDLINEMKAGKVDLVLFWDVNPLYDYPYAGTLRQALQKVKYTIALAERRDETARECQFVIPTANPYESWRDYQPSAKTYFIAQPVIRSIFGARQFESSLLKWMGQSDDYHAYLKQYWQEQVYPALNTGKDAEAAWQAAVHDAYVALPPVNETAEATTRIDIAQVVQQATQIPAYVPKPDVVYLYEPVALGSGRYSNNAWLQEIPDPITKVVGDNVVLVGPAYARQLGLKTEDVVRVKVMKGTGSQEFHLPVVVQPGMPPHAVAIAVGYGRQGIGKVAETGVNVYPLAELVQQGNKYYTQWEVGKVQIEPAGQTYPLAITQGHFRLEGRPIVKETTLEAWKEDPWAGNEERKDREKIEKLRKTTFYPEREFVQHWDMVIDLTLCIGCGACIAACDVENNVAVVGKEEVRRVHEMHWLRIDLYYSGDEENPEAVHQPMLCQHCDHAPCENVCPVAATNNSQDGINQMAYNRCIGTRYCANNCPYKVRRFNWYDYTGADSFPGNERIVPDGPFDKDTHRLILNPDVVVRSRGVMEKCSFCIQRIQEAKLRAKAEGRRIRDGEVKTACQQACPTGAIRFGDGADPQSEVAQIIQGDERLYYVLEELHTLPSVGYLVKIRNTAQKA